MFSASLVYEGLLERHIFHELLSCKFVHDSDKALWMIHDLFQCSIAVSCTIKTLITYSVELNIKRLLCALNEKGFDYATEVAILEVSFH
jgi:hypothetical protein